MKIDSLISKYLTKSDVDPPKLLTFKKIVRENVARKGEAEELKPVAYFAEQEKGLVLNKTNLRRVASALGSAETDDWVGKRIVAYNDESIEFGGEIVGGIRLRAPKAGAGQATSIPPPKAAQSEAEFDDESAPW